MKSSDRTVILGVVGLAAVCVAAIYVHRLLEEKPLNLRIQDGQTKVIGMQIRALEKVKSVTERACDLVDKIKQRWM